MTDYTEYTVHEHKNGDRFWFLGDQLGRINGPAVEFADGTCSWYLDDKCMSEEEHKRRTSQPEEMTLAEVCEALGKNIKIVKG